MSNKQGLRGCWVEYGIKEQVLEMKHWKLVPSAGQTGGLWESPCQEIPEVSPDNSVDEESACNAGDPGLIPGLGRSTWRRDRLPTPVSLGFLGGSAGNESACNVGDLG